jgi:hypothetical protein
MGNALGLAVGLTANKLSVAGVLNAYLRANNREEAQHKNASPET